MGCCAPCCGKDMVSINKLRPAKHKTWSLQTKYLWPSTRRDKANSTRRISHSTSRSTPKLPSRSSWMGSIWTKTAQLPRTSGLPTGSTFGRPATATEPSSSQYPYHYSAEKNRAGNCTSGFPPGLQLSDRITPGNPHQGHIKTAAEWPGSSPLHAWTFMILIILFQHNHIVSNCLSSLSISSPSSFSREMTDISSYSSSCTSFLSSLNCSSSGRLPLILANFRNSLKKSLEWWLRT